jgi:large subunit ribosomal protein L25
MITLSASKRTTESPKTLLKEEKVPAVYYGAGKEAVSISIPLKEFNKVWKEAGETGTVALDFGKEKVTTLIHDVQRDVITNSPIHADFLVIDMNKEIEVDIPLEFTGLAEAEKAGLGTVVHTMHEIKVKALPANLPHALTVDVTSLSTLESQIHAKDVVLPKGVTLVDSADEVVAMVSAFKEEKEEVTPIDLSSIEVEKKGKKEEEGAEATAE